MRAQGSTTHTAAHPSQLRTLNSPPTHMHEGSSLMMGLTPLPPLHRRGPGLNSQSSFFSTAEQGMSARASSCCPMISAFILACCCLLVRFRRVLSTANRAGGAGWLLCCADTLCVYIESIHFGSLQWIKKCATDRPSAGVSPEPRRGLSASSRTTKASLCAASPICHLHQFSLSPAATTLSIGSRDKTDDMASAKVSCIAGLRDIDLLAVCRALCTSPREAAL